MAIPTNPERQQPGLDLILRRNVELFPDRIALDDRSHGRTFTFSELYKRSTRLARALQSQGVEKGDLVAYAFFNEHASIEALFACCILGAVAVPLNNRLAQVEARDYLNRQHCKVFMSNVELIPMGADTDVSIRIVRGGSDLPDETSDYENLLAAEEDTPLPAVSTWGDPYMMAMTGGTTGGPKAAVWGHGGLMMDILSVMVHMEIKRRTCTVMVAPTYHAAGLGWALLPCLWQGGKVILPPTPAFDPAFLLSECATGEVKYLMLVPAMIEPMYKAWDGKPIKGVESAAVASAPTPETQRRKLQEIFPDTHIFNGYGMTETFSMAVQSAGEWLDMPTSAGEPSAVTRIRLVDDEGRRVPTGEIGHVMGRTVSMCLYYNNDPDNTASAFKPMVDDPEGLEWMATGDMGYLDEDGILTLVDRAKDVVITGGENVHSVEVENIILSHSGVTEVGIIGLPDDTWGERVVAVLVKSDPALDEEQLAAEVLKICRDNLAGFKVPKQVAYLEALPRTPFGKVLKREMVKMDYPGALNASDIEKKAT